MSRKRLTPEEYTVGWLCALECEYWAAILMLDERHASLPNLNASDENVYTYGEINEHNVVIARMPTGETGKVSAALTAQFLKDSFKMKVYLFVGIGGGYPYHIYWDNQPIRLGDVVVGSPKATGNSAVVEYDRGRMIPGDFLSFSILGRPIRQLVSVVDQLEMNAAMGDSSFDRHLNRLNIENLTKRKVDFNPGRFAYPGSQYDILFRSDSKHKGGPDPTCSNCDRTAVLRNARPDNKPVFHRGTIASGDSVIQDAEKRDELSERFDHAICFEMEAAGVMDLTHCLVIRGISDYADTHKHYIWHDYAAATAAAFAREILHTLPLTILKEVESKPLSTQDPPAEASSSFTAPPTPGVLANSDQVGLRVEATNNSAPSQKADAPTGSANSAGNLATDNPNQHKPLTRLFRRKDY